MVKGNVEKAPSIKDAVTRQYDGMYPRLRTYIQEEAQGYVMADNYDIPWQGQREYILLLTVKGSLFSLLRAASAPEK